MAKDYILRTSVEGLNDGQPPTQLNAKFRRGRAIDELIGVCRGILADKDVLEGEAIYLLRWLKENEEVCSVWPANIITNRLCRIYADGRITPEELEDLRLLLCELVGERPEKMASAEDAGSLNLKRTTSLPFDKPEPQIIFSGKRFCFSGRFVGGTRSWCEMQVLKRGGIPVDDPEEYLIVGTLGSRDWAHSTHGRKIEAAQLRRGKDWPKIVSEEHWSKFIGDDPVAAGVTFKDGFAEGFRMAIRDCFKESLRQMEFEKGEVFYDAREAYTLPWNEAVQKLNLIVKIKDESRDKVWFTTSTKVENAFIESKLHSLLWKDFVALLKTADIGTLPQVSI